ncbi:MAG TPA: DUF4159 domain-containing protein [Rhizomicrobium sp.]|jgi:hypothetical protein|nr:DUF4159 domain-containing protein [Rhizomicrobium sp.]
MTALSAITFTTPWLLWALAALPAIWFLLRVTPPAPRRVVFPPLRLLLGLAAPQETPARTPWWLLLLRLFAAALLIVALAGPSIGEAPKSAGHGPLVLFVDNGWTAAHGWQAREAAITDALESAAHAGRPVAIVPTAGPRAPLVTLLSAGEAERTAHDLAPEPYAPDRTRALAALAKAKLDAPNIFWLSDGLDESNARVTADGLAQLGHLTVYGDAHGRGPLGLRPEKNEPDGFIVTVIRAEADAPRAGQVSAIGAHGEVLASAPFHFKPRQSEAVTKISLPLEVRNETQRIVIANEDSAGAVRLLDKSAKRRAIGLVSASNLDTEQPLLSDVYYLERALSPYADVRRGTIGEALDRGVSILMLADIGEIAGADHDRVARFVQDGGILVRFAGERMTQKVDDLIPVKLRLGGRYLGGALNWSQPQHLAPFPDTSPFRGLSIPAEVTVSRQVLAEPSVDLGEKSWARLADGTPLVTAEQRGKGWIVLFHVTASPAWSNLPLSGLYPDMLRRVIDLASGARPSDMGTDASAVYPPYETLDGFGHARKPPAEALPVRGIDLGRLEPSPLHPPGLYGSEGAQIALNAVGAKDTLAPMGDIGTRIETYTGTAAMALEAPLLALAILILIGDAILSLMLRGYVLLPRATKTAALLLALLLIHPFAARADPADDMKAALDTRLAYVITGVPDVDATSKAGLTGLGDYLKARTSYAPLDPVGVNLDRDDLSFYPLLYWPMDPREKDLSPAALSRVANYMRNGGTILFDTRDLSLGATIGPNSPGEQTLRRLTAKLDIPPLEPVPPDHVLTKAFYLLQDFPGRWTGSKVWVERLPPADPDAGPQPARGGDDVSPVIIGGNDWAAAWAVDKNGQPLHDVSPGGEEQREMAVRFGINVVMYALTGNYKTDQVHAPALLERLGH